MDTFEKAFGRKRVPNTRKRTFANISRGLDAGYIEFFRKATIYYLNGDLQKSLENINLTIEKSDINDCQHFAFKANLYEDLKDYQTAIDNYKLAIEYAIDDVVVYALYHQIGYCYLSLNKNQEAVDFFTYAINLKEQHPNSEYCPDEEGLNGGVLLGVPFKRMYNNRGNALKNIGKLDEALQDCQKSISYDNNYSNPYLLAGQIYAQAGQKENAIKCTQLAAQLGNVNAISILQRLGL